MMDIVPYFLVAVIVTDIMILVMFIVYFGLKQQDKHFIRHYDQKNKIQIRSLRNLKR